MIYASFAGGLITAADGGDSRTIAGVAVPFNTVATVSDGRRVRFEPGSLPLTGPAPRLLESHDPARLVGLVTSRTETATGVAFTARVSRTRAGDDALQLALDGALSSVSVGVTPTEHRLDDDGVLVISAADWMELSLVPFPAFAGAVIERVAATSGEHDEPEHPLGLDTNNHQENLMDEQNEQPVAASPQPTLASLAAPRVRASAAEYLSAYLTGSPRFAEIQSATGSTGDIPGVLPTPIVGAVYDNLRSMRPFVDAIGVRAMPAGGKVFIRPKITTHATVAQQAAEHDALSSTALVVDDIQLTKKTFGGSLTLSEQEVDWSDPSIVQIVLDDLMGRYADATEADACSSITAGSTTAGVVWTSAASVVEAIYDAASTISAASGFLPNAIAVGTTRWADLGKLADSSNRPLFPVLAPSNALGQASAGSWAANVLGLQVIVTKGLAATDVFVLNTRGVEAFEQPKGAIQASDPATLGVTLSWRGYFVAHTIDTGKVVELTA